MNLLATIVAVLFATKTIALTLKHNNECLLDSIECDITKTTGFKVIHPDLREESNHKSLCEKLEDHGDPNTWECRINGSMAPCTRCVSRYFMSSFAVKNRERICATRLISKVMTPLKIISVATILLMIFINIFMLLRAKIMKKNHINSIPICTIHLVIGFILLGDLIKIFYDLSLSFKQI